MKTATTPHRFYPTTRTASVWLDRTKIRNDEVRFLRAYLREGDTYVDVGANIGELVLTAASAVGGGGRIVAIEAHPIIFKYLTGNVALNRIQNITLRTLASKMFYIVTATFTGRLQLLAPFK